MTKDRRNTLQLILAVGMVVFGCLIVIISLVIPPTGEIHYSVLTAFGEILTFAGTVIGIDYKYKDKTHIEGNSKSE